MDVSEALAQAAREHRAGHAAQAEAICRQILELDPNQPDALSRLGALAFSAGRLDEALVFFDRAIAARPGDAAGQRNRAMVLAALGRIDEAIAAVRQALVLRADFAEAWLDLGIALRQTGHADEAIAAMRRAVELRPEYAEALNTLGVALAQRGRRDEAAAAFGQALAARPDFPGAWNNLGNVLREQGKVDQAVAAFGRALALQPRFAEALNNLGNALAAIGQPERAIEQYQQALSVRPGYVEAMCNLGAALAQQERWAEAMQWYRRALGVEPRFSLAMFNLAAALAQQGRWKETIETYRKALALEPNHPAANLNLGMALLIVGEFPEGFARNEWRWRVAAAPTAAPDFGRPQWDGSDLAGRRILLRSEQGLGDAIQFARYAPMVAARGGKVLLAVPRILRSLLKGARAVDGVFVEGEEVGEFDVQCPLLSLPGVIGTTVQTIPADVPYLKADEALAARWRGRIGEDPRLKVGLVWAGSAGHRNDRNRSIPPGLLGALGRSGARFFSLQKAATAQRPGLEMLDWTAELGDFSDTAALIANLDLIISCDTAVAHLAGAMGKPVWVMLPLAHDWRWLLNRDDSPWYPTMRLFRQKRAGDWAAVVEEVTRALAALAPQRQQPDTLYNFGNAMRRAGRLEDSITAYRHAIALRGGFAEAQNNLGVALQSAGRFEEAMGAYQRALALRPTHAETRRNLAGALKDTRRLDEAIAAYQEVVTQNPEDAEAISGLGCALKENGRVDEAITAHRRAIELRPNYAEGHGNLGVALVARGECEEAIAAYRRALAIDPNYAQAHVNLALALLLTGDLPGGFAENEWRWRALRPATDGPDFGRPRWDGSPLAGRRILLHHEQGLGDTIQFVRYARLLAERGGRVLVLCQHELRRLLKSAPGVETVFADGDRAGEFDLQCPLMSLPLLLKTTVETIPADVPYLKADEQLVARWRQRIGDDGRPKVGLVWAGNPEQTNDPVRSIPPKELAALAGVDARFFSLQKGQGKRATQRPGFETVDWMSEIEDFADTAALIANLDLVISCCTSVAHLAGAMGKPVWTLLAFAADWRWLRGRPDSPWYPTMRLFRQKQMGQWQLPVQEATEALDSWVRKRSGQS